ncbi:hypothetical protein TgHK011_005835 [Trichoderma gracile]|nr:hypothetical protein TgHK011_005835 [Trichoderma gracile]
MTCANSDTAIRGAILALKATTDLSSTEIAQLLHGVSVRQVNRVYSRAIKAGFDPSARPLQITNALVADRPKSGRPRKKIRLMEPGEE